MNDPIVYSTSKALWHVDKLKNLQEGKMIVPTLLQIDPEAFCNDNCEFCAYRKDNGYNNEMLKLIDANPGEKYYDNKPIGRLTSNSGLPLEMAEKIPLMMKEAGIPAIEITGGGEPTLWRGFDSLLDNLIKEEIEIGLVTNGSTLPDSRLHKLGEKATWVRFSMDSSNAELHQKIHRTPNLDFERRIDNIRKLISYKHKDLIIGISFIVTPQNYDDVVKSALFYKELGVSHIRFSYMYDKEGHSGLTMDQIERMKKVLKNLKAMDETDSFRIYYERDRIDNYSRPNDDFKKCYMQRFVWALGADCKVYPCCIVKYWPAMAFGDIREKTLKQMVEDINVKARMDDLNVSLCPPCWLRERNKEISIGIEKPVHANFI